MFVGYVRVGVKGKVFCRWLIIWVMLRYLGNLILV